MEAISAAPSDPAIDQGQRVLVNSGRLKVHWHGVEIGDAAVSLEADQLLWWNIRPDSVVLEGRFHLRPIGGKLREVEIAADPRLRLLPAIEAAAIGRVAVEEGEPDIVRVTFSEPAVTETDLRLSWVW